MYHPRWNSRDLQVAEERYLRFCSVSALMNQLPKWTKIYPPLNGLAKVATCKTVLQIIRSILFYALYTDKLIASRAPDVVLITTLHLLSLALDISQAQIESQSGGFDNSIPLLVFAAEEISTGLNDGYDDQSLLLLLVSLMRINKKENAYNYVESGGFDLCSLIKNLLQKFAELDVGCLTKLQMLAPEVVNQLSYSSDVSNNSAPVSDSEKRKAKARERQAAITVSQSFPAFLDLRKTLYLLALYKFDPYFICYSNFLNYIIRQVITKINYSYIITLVF